MTSNKKQYKILFTDLDGTLIETISKEPFPKGIWDMKFKFDVLNAIKALKPDYICIVTNQGGIEKGFVNEQAFIYKFEYVKRAIKEYTGIITINEYCKVNNPNVIFRKPNVGMLRNGLYDINVINFNNKYDKRDCLMIGDASGLEGQYSDTDKKTAENFGIDYLDVAEFVKVYDPNRFIYPYI